MSDSSRRDNASLGRLGRAAFFLAVIGITLFLVNWCTATDARLGQIPQNEAAKCTSTEECERKALALQAEEAFSARFSVDVGQLQTFFNFLGLVGLALTVHFARKAWREAERGADAAHLTFEVARKDAEEQAVRLGEQMTLSRQSAEAATRAAQVTWDVGRRQGKAHLVIDRAEAFTDGDPDYIRFRGVVRNIGKSPATNVTVNVMSDIRVRFPAPDGAVLPNQMGTSRTVVIALAAGDSGSFETEVAVWPNDPQGREPARWPPHAFGLRWSGDVRLRVIYDNFFDPEPERLDYFFTPGAGVEVAHEANMHHRLIGVQRLPLQQQLDRMNDNNL